jgi:flavin reductase (DIM6/NTAB) family NADH-FMN oxidoreductase RutF
MNASESTSKAEPANIEPALFRRVMGRFATGVTVVSTALDGKAHCMTANAFMSGSLEPPLCVISVAKKARMHDILLRARHFAVNMLAEDQEQYSRHFSGRPVEGLEPAFEFVGETPLLVERIAAIAARVGAIHPCGDHSLFIGAIFHMSATGNDEPLVYHAGRYAALAHPRGLDLLTPGFW